MNPPHAIGPRFDGKAMFAAFLSITVLTWALGLIGEHYRSTVGIAFTDGFPGDPATWDLQGDAGNIEIDTASVTIDRSIDTRSSALKPVRFPEATDPAVERLLRVHVVVDTLAAPSPASNESATERRQATDTRPTRPARVMMFLLDDVDADPTGYRTILELDGAEPSVGRSEVIGLEANVHAGYFVLTNEDGDGRFRVHDARLELVEVAPGRAALALALGAAWTGFAVAATAWLARRLGWRGVASLMIPTTAIVIGVMLPEHLRVPFAGDWVERVLAGLRNGNSDAMPSAFKLGHFAFFLITAAVAFSLRRRLGMSLVALLACFLVFAFATEGLQLHLHDRTTRLSDIGIDLVGAMLGVLTMATVSARSRCRSVPHDPPCHPSTQSRSRMDVLSNSRTLAHRALQPLLRRRAFAAIDILSSSGAQGAPLVAAALQATLRGSRTREADAERWVRRIERLRAEMNESDAPVSQHDFGAGRAAEEEDEARMRAGVLRESTVGAICRSLSKPPFWSVLLFELVRRQRPLAALELGTALGISSAYQGAALALSGGGRLVTLEGNVDFADLARANFERLDLDNVEVVVGRFDLTLHRVLERAGQLSWVFVDGHHDERATLAYFEQLLPRLAPGALVAFDDIAWSAGMTRAWRKIVEHPRCSLSVDLGTLGLCVVGASAGIRPTVRIPLRGIL